MKNALKPNVATARQLFLYGAGDGKRVLSTTRLQELTGAHPETLRKHMPAWQKEAEEIVASSSENGLALHLSKETLDDHKRDMVVLRGEINRVSYELKNTEKVTAKLEGWMDKFDGEESEQERALRILELWVRTCGQVSSLRSQFLALQKQWTALVGIIAMADVQIAQAKTLATGRAKLDLEREKNEAGPRDANSPIGGIFARPKNPDQDA